MLEVGGRNGSGGSRVPIRSFRDLEVYQLSMAALKPIHELVRTFPAHEQRDLADQLRRAAKSIPATIAEGYARRDSAKEFRRYLRIAMGSATEMEVHLDIALRLGYISEQHHQRFIDEYQLIARKLYRLIQAWRKLDPSDLRPPTSDLADEYVVGFGDES